ncbi:MAG: substrate-binding periplasmic protein [Polaromonas sp.]|jgi:polar amino acid transport system substrate-binding protein
MFKFLTNLCLLALLSCSAHAQVNASKISAVIPNTATGQAMFRATDGRLIAPDIAQILARGELVVAVLATDTPPFVHQKGGKLVGVDIELVEEVAKELKVPVRYDRSSKTYDEIIQLVASDKADMGVSKLARTLKRAQTVLFSIPYVNLDHSLLVNRLEFAKMARDQSVTRAMQNFTGKMGVLGGSAWEEFARRNFPRATVVAYPSWPKVIEAVKTGQVVAAYRDAVEVRSIMDADATLALTLRTVSFTDLQSQICVVMRDGDAVLVSFVNALIANRTEKITVNKLLAQLK